LSQRLNFYQPPNWLQVDKEKFSFKVVKLPQAEEIEHNFNLSLVIDYYSRQ
jgi:ribosomal protein S4